MRPSEPVIENSPHRQADDEPLYCVIGSGLAGVACAKALLGRGQKVQMLDPGIVLEAGRAELVRKLAGRLPGDWNKSDLAAYQAGMNPDVGGVPLKLVYGSDFAYRDANEHLGISYTGAGLRPSFAKGGLSNVWGAAMMPYLDRDLKAWPFPVEALEPHYQAVLRFTGLAATRDALAELFPLHTNHSTELRLSRQAQQMLATMERHRAMLDRAGIHFGRSRLAVRGNNAAGKDGCVYCRLCMYGCPYDYIYSSALTIPELACNSKFIYEPGVVVTSLREAGEKVEISGYEREGRKPRAWKCDRVFVAAGTIATTQILLRSLQAYDETVWLKDSQYFLVPLLLTRKVRGAAHESLHGLSQLFMEFLGANEGPAAHVQIYSNSDLVNQAVANSLGWLGRTFGFLRRDLEDRLLIAQGFLHSDRSSRMAVTLKKIKGQERLELRGEINPEARREVKRIVNQLLRQAPRLGAVAIPPMVKIAEPGRSFHSGGSFPMNKSPGKFQSDLLGRLPGWKRVHAVDATVFPSIPATTISVSAMANAHRIGWEAAQLDQPRAEVMERTPQPK